MTAVESKSNSGLHFCLSFLIYPAKCTVYPIPVVTDTYTCYAKAKYFGSNNKAFPHRPWSLSHGNET